MAAGLLIALTHFGFLGLVLVLIALPATTTTAGLVVTASGSSAAGARRLRRQWGRAPIPLLDPRLPGTPQPRAPGHTSPEGPVLLTP